MTTAAYLHISKRRGLHLKATASLGEEFQGPRGPAAVGGGGRSNQQGEWKRRGRDKRWVSSGWVVWQVGGASMTDAHGGGEKRCKREKKEKNFIETGDVWSNGAEQQTTPPTG